MAAESEDEEYFETTDGLLLIVALAVLSCLVLAAAAFTRWWRRLPAPAAAPVRPTAQSPMTRQGRARPGDLIIEGCQARRLSALMGRWILKRSDTCNGQPYYYRPTKTRNLFLYHSGKNEWKVRVHILRASAALCE